MKWLSWKLMFLVGVIAYLPSLGNGFLWDDYAFFVDNESVTLGRFDRIFSESTTSGVGQVSNYYRPLTSLTFALDKAVWGLNPMGFHLTNLVLHSMAGVALFELLVRMGMKREEAGVVAVAFFQVEAVAYANSRGDSLYALLLFVGANCWAEAFGKNTKVRKGKLIALAVGCYLLAILAKEVAVVGVGLYGLISVKEIVEKKKWKKWKDYKAQIVGLVAALGGVAGYVWLRLTKLNFLDGYEFSSLGSEYTNSLWVRVMTFGRVFWEYMKVLVWPMGLHYERMVPIVKGVNIWFAGMVGVSLLILWLGWREYREKGKMWIWFGFFWWWIFIFPFTGVLPGNALLYEHWLYVALVGLMIVLVGGWRGRRLGWLAVGGLVVWMGLTWRQIEVWAEPIGFYRYNIERRETGRLWTNLCHTYREEGDYEEAIGACGRALELKEGMAPLATGILMEEMGDWGQARMIYEAQLNNHPEDFMSRRRLIGVYRQMGDRQRLRLEVEELVESEPGQWQNWFMLGKVEWEDGRDEQAQKAWQKAEEVAKDKMEVRVLMEKVRMGI